MTPEELAAKQAEAAEKSRKDKEAQEQRERAIAASKLPGAGVVGKALEVSDSAKVRANEPIPEP